MMPAAAAIPGLVVPLEVAPPVAAAAGAWVAGARYTVPVLFP